ncbi:hypothetical protein [uncultured Draconibacterium sp.]|uniref:hypothetical protein n=1 Tax=uncultured Draconibacterium sp. TaxID=1573823 RepID=UPI0025D89BF6|nr:hypothetical protein [uncultured Draconibacterium sp.]
MNYDAIEYPEGQANLGGLRSVGYYGFIADASVIPDVPAEPADLQSVSVIANNIIMKSGKYMHAMYGTLEKLNLKGELQGERDGRSSKVTLTWVIPNHAKENLGAARYFPKRRMFFIVRDHEGRYRLVGNMYFPAEVAATDDSGTAVADLKHVSYEITTFSDGPAPIYEGEIPSQDDSSAV